MTTRRAIEFLVLMLAILAAISLGSSYANARNYNAWEREMQRDRINRMEYQMRADPRRRQQQEMYDLQRRAQESFNRSMDEALRRRKGY
jgi:hypothetical protein